MLGRYQDISEVRALDEEKAHPFRPKWSNDKSEMKNDSVFKV